MSFKTEDFEKYFTICEDIGRGQFAIVKRCFENSTRRQYAAKFIRISKLKGSRRGVTLDKIKNEIKILEELSHPNVVKLYDSFHNGNHVILVMELINGGELFNYIYEHEHLSEETASEFIKQVLLGLEHIHSKNIVHLDIKPENILLSTQTSSVKLIDFGLSKKLCNGKDIRDMTGTPEYVSPEIVNYEPLCLVSDMWSVGVLTYIMLSGVSPFLGNTQQDTYANIMAVNYSFEHEPFNNISGLAKDFISSLLIKDPRRRANLLYCLNHPWIKPFHPLHEIQLRSGIDMESFKSFQVRRKWKHSLKIVVLCNRLSKSNKLHNGSIDVFGNLSFKMEPKFAGVRTKDDNFVLKALLVVVEEGNLNGLKELLDAAPKIDLNLANKHGETAVHLAASHGHVEVLKFLVSHGASIHVTDNHGDTPLYWAARQSQLDTLKYLVDQGGPVNSVNKNGETCLHVACRYGHSSIVQYLCSLDGLNLDGKDDQEESGLHIAVWHGFPRIVYYLLLAGADCDLVDMELETPLHAAAGRGHLESVRCLVEGGASLNPCDKFGRTPLHLALRRHHTKVAMLLLHAGSNFEGKDENGERPIHIAAREGLVSIAQTLCAFGCEVNVPNNDGDYPLHLAAKHGHIEIVRCLCLAGCSVDLKNKQGLLADFSAVSQGHRSIGVLLRGLTDDSVRENCIGQLIPSQEPITKIKMKLFGHSGVGKTALIETLQTGKLGGLFRRSRSLTSPKTSMSSKGSVSSRCSIDPDSLSPQSSLNHSLSMDSHNTRCNHGIGVSHININGVGEFSVWEFSGNEAYYGVYDHFIGNTNCLHVIVFSLEKPPDVQLQQVIFWMEFLQTRLSPLEPLGECGKSYMAAKILLVATHADVIGCVKNSSGNYTSPQVDFILEKVQNEFGRHFDVHDKVYILDSLSHTSAGFRQFKQYITETQQKVLQSFQLQGLPKNTGFLEAVRLILPSWRKQNDKFPVITWSQFVDEIRNLVNPLAGEEHLIEVIQQLQLMGEVFCLKSNNQDLVILSPLWLCTDIIGNLLSPDYCTKSKQNGCYTVEDFQMTFPDTDALDLLQVLEALQLCTQCDNEGEIEYEFPIFNSVSWCSDAWNNQDDRYQQGVYFGLRFRPSILRKSQHFEVIFPRIQSSLRRWALELHDPNLQLHQRTTCSKVCFSFVEALISVAEGGYSLELKIRCPKVYWHTNCFYFFHDLVGIVEEVLSEICPGLILEYHVLSPRDLSSHHQEPFVYTPYTINETLLNRGQQARLTGPDGHLETILDILGIKSPDLLNNLTWSHDIPASELSLPLQQEICFLLDPPDPLGKDWCLLAVQLGISDQLPKLDAGNNPTVSRTSRVLSEWSKESEATVGKLIRHLEELGRHDAARMLLMSLPFFKIKVQPPPDDSPVEEPQVGSCSGTSCSNLSR